MYLLKNSKALSFMLVKSTDKNDKKKRVGKEKKQSWSYFKWHCGQMLWGQCESEDPEFKVQ